MKLKWGDNSWKSGGGVLVFALKNDDENIDFYIFCCLEKTKVSFKYGRQRKEDS